MAAMIRDETRILSDVGHPPTRTHKELGLAAAPDRGGEEEAVAGLGEPWCARATHAKGPRAPRAPPARSGGGRAHAPPPPPPPPPPPRPPLYPQAVARCGGGGCRGRCLPGPPPTPPPCPQWPRRACMRGRLCALLSWGAVMRAGRRRMDGRGRLSVIPGRYWDRCASPGGGGGCAPPSRPPSPTTYPCFAVSLGDPSPCTLPSPASPAWLFAEQRGTDTGYDSVQSRTSRRRCSGSTTTRGCWGASWWMKRGQPSAQRAKGVSLGTTLRLSPSSRPWRGAW